MSRLATAALALGVDALLGEPPSALHPTVWMGRWIGMARRSRRSTAPGASLAEGAAWIVGGALATALAARVVARGVDRPPGTMRVLATAAALKPALSLRALVAAGGEVEAALRRNQLDEARRLLSWHLVSRDTSSLSAAEVAGAAIESLAENLGDGVVGPLLAFRAGGLPAAYAYRFLNTADAMLGYRTEELEWFGKTAARLDDAANLAPARAAALAVALASPIAGGDASAAVRVALRDAGRTGATVRLI